MTMNRRDLLGSAMLLAAPALTLPAGVRAGAPAGPRIMCWNENPYGPSPAARRVMAASIAEGCRYPSDDELKALVRRLALHEGTDSQHIVIGTGTNLVVTPRVAA